MGRLIDADTLQFNGRNYNKSQMKAILDFIDAQPTAYDPDKVVQQIKELSIRELGEIKTEDVITIVKGGGVDGN